MSNVVEFKSRTEPPAEDQALGCTCGCISWLLLGDGNIECGSCHWVMPAEWRFTCLDADIHTAEEEHER